MTRLICLRSEGTSTQPIAVISWGLPACTPTPRMSTAVPTSTCQGEVLGLRAWGFSHLSDLLHHLSSLKAPKFKALPLWEIGCQDKWHWEKKLIIPLTDLHQTNDANQRCRQGGAEVAGLQDERLKVLFQAQALGHPCQPGPNWSTIL